MAEEPRLNDDLESLAAALSGLTLQPGHVNRGQLMYEAGRAAALAGLARHRRSVLIWKGIASASMISAACFGWLLISPILQRPVAPGLPDNVAQPSAHGPGGSVVPLNAPEKLDVPQVPSSSFGPQVSYLGQRNLALAQGLDVLPQSPATRGGAQPGQATYSELLQSLVDSRDFGG